MEIVQYINTSGNVYRNSKSINRTLLQAQCDIAKVIRKGPKVPIVIGMNKKVSSLRALRLLSVLCG